MRAKFKVEERFWNKVNFLAPRGCWEWVGSCDTAGYGQICIDDVMVLCHRYSYELEHRAPLPAGMLVCHHCDNTKCVRPEHLFLGTNLDNVRDMEAKGRARRRSGEQHGMAVLNKESVRQIRLALAHGAKQKDLAAQYGVAAVTISAIHTGRLWRSE